MHCINSNGASTIWRWRYALYHEQRRVNLLTLTLRIVSPTTALQPFNVEKKQSMLSGTLVVNWHNSSASTIWRRRYALYHQQRRVNYLTLTLRIVSTATARYLFDVDVTHCITNNGDSTIWRWLYALYQQQRRVNYLTLTLRIVSRTTARQPFDVDVTHCIANNGFSTIWHRKNAINAERYISCKLAQQQRIYYLTLTLRIVSTATARQLFDVDVTHCTSNNGASTIWRRRYALYHQQRATLHYIKCIKQSSYFRQSMLFTMQYFQNVIFHVKLSQCMFGIHGPLFWLFDEHRCLV